MQSLTLLSVNQQNPYADNMNSYKVFFVDENGKEKGIEVHLGVSGVLMVERLGVDPEKGDSLIYSI